MTGVLDPIGESKLFRTNPSSCTWSTGEILECLKRNGLAKDTVIFFTSDNDPWFEGDPGHQRGRKGQSYEGGFRVPMIVRYPNLIPAGTICDEPAMTVLTPV